MRCLPLALLVPSLVLPSLVLLEAPAAAQSAEVEAVTYEGTIGRLPILLELAVPDPGGSGPFGRYAYRSRGADIPLNGRAAEAGVLVLEEEAPCTKATCTVTEEGLASPPIAADWRLQRRGTGLSGTWTGRSGGKVLPIRLQRSAVRTVAVDAGSTPQQALLPQNSPADPAMPAVLDPAALPYDFLKLDAPREPGEETERDGVTVRMETDPRSGVAFPTVVALGDADPGPINAYLLQQRLQAELPYLACKAENYAGFGWTEMHPGTPADPDAAAAEAEEEEAGGPSISLDLVSPRLIGLSQRDSFYCGGAHPNNYTVHYLADAATGTAIVPETLLAGWRADAGDGTAGPSPELVGYVTARREQFDAEQEESCGFDELIANRFYFGVYFTEAAVVFTLRELPHAIYACTNDLLTVPLSQARTLLTEQGARYFAELDE
jgi:hypothetical protein